jgi:hypothetical protein
MISTSFGLWKSHLTFPSLGFHNCNVRIKLYKLKVIVRAKNIKGKAVNSELNISTT